MKLARGLFGYTKTLTMGFLTGGSRPEGGDYFKLARVCCFRKYGSWRGQSLALAGQLLKIMFQWCTRSR